ncbi:glycosyltransferase [Roseimaritima ulvae]|uniref:GalNAc-alpha-(1->4)-GalNAc-alpha-(1->3)-diNAcBac-PP-undecaprenol alpha-1,4-N-acetyl-D-galactosaminyltransferase n=1 Tax=Roseimaritima ulvae TaxID=980254 RepID=A0A5B9QS02_9BACT|nr:glycosyltransferase [Roseimaritima ulvae]QEG40145.1 GalNAc-alpha-(1->4)-GalNAc-alpha-(1->3)-diNAcBac-PP-undecaprenol alpha-1,4-N-acetyl-D-galactosaminyltransferase [Roseimaritima ulvae]
MRIDFIITELSVGGAERCLTELAIGMSRRGHGVRVISLAPPPAPPRDELASRLEQAAVPLLSARSASSYLAPLALMRVRKLLRDERPDLVQTFLFHANVLGTAAAAMAGVPVRVGGVRVAQRRPGRLWLERRLVRKMQGLICVSRSVADFAQQYLATSDTDIHVIPNAVDVPRFADARPLDWQTFDLPETARVVLFVGRLDPQKGLERLFAAAQRFLAEDPQAWLVLVGDGPLRSWCDQQCRSMPGQRARRLPWQADVAPLMRAARLFMLCSRYEGMPNVVLEAMAAGRPVVCNEVEGVAELLNHAPQQQCVPQGDVPALATAANHWLADEDEANRIGAANQTYVRQHHTIEAMLDGYEQLYAQWSRPTTAP